MCGFYYITFIEYLLAGKTLLNYANLFSANDYKKNDKKCASILGRKKIQVLNFDWKNETKIYLLEEIKHNDLMSEKYKNACI